MADAETRVRELGALKKLDARSPLKKMVVVTREESERVELSDGRIVEVMPLAEWLLEIEERSARVAGLTTAPGSDARTNSR